MTAPAKTSLRSPATMWAAPVTFTYSLCGHISRKLLAPSSLRMSDNPPRTSRVGSVRLRAQASSRSWRCFRSRRGARNFGSQCQW